MRLAELPRVRLAELPTPLQRAPRLSEALGVEVLVKRDDLTGLGLGGLTRVATIAADCLALLGVEAADVVPEILDGYIGRGYGKPSDAGHSAATLAARTEGLVLDPVFTAKAMAALVERAHDDGGPVVFWHTGGGATAVAAGMLGEGGEL